MNQIEKTLRFAKMYGASEEKIAEAEAALAYQEALEEEFRTTAVSK